MGTADENGYQEVREIQSGFVEIRPQPARVEPVQPVAPVTPAPAPRPRPTPAPTPAPAPNDDDLVAQIIAQLTPFIRDTVSSSLQGNQGRQTSRSSAPPPAPRRRAPQ